MVFGRCIHVLRSLAAIISLCLCYAVYPTTHTNDGTINNHGEIEISAGNTLQNNDTIHNYHAITGLGTILHSPTAMIYNYANFQQYLPSDAYLQYVTEDVPGAIAQDYGHATYYELVNREQAGGIRTFSRWQASYVADTLNVPNRDAHIEERADYSTLYDPTCEQTAILHDTHTTISINSYLSDVNVYPSFFSLDGYSSSNPYVVPPVDRNIVIRKIGAKHVTFHGDNSWFNGLFKLEAGNATVLDTGKMFGGDIELATGTKMTWQGGEKDEYNCPHVMVAPNAELNFDLPQGDNAIFSLYGSISGDPDATGIPYVTFTNGTVYVKGDCSGFKGRVTVESGAQFVIKKSDATSTAEYEGKMFGGDLVISGGGGEAGEIDIKSNSGLTPMHLTNGTVNIRDDDTPGLPSGSQTIDTLEIDQGAKVNLAKEAESLMKDSVIEGELEVSAGNNLTLQDTKLSGGIFNLTSRTMQKIKILGNLTVGSTINALNDLCVAVEAPAGSHLIFDPAGTEALHLSCCADPQNNNSFKMLFSNTENADNGQIIMEQIRLLTPMTTEEFIFPVLQLTDPNPQYPQMVASDNLVIDGVPGVDITGIIGTIVGDGRNGQFRLYRPGGDDWEYIDGLTPEQTRALNIEFIPLEQMHAAGMSITNNLIGDIDSMNMDSGDFGSGDFGNDDFGDGNFGNDDFGDGNFGNSDFGDSGFGGSDSGTGNFGDNGFGGSDSGSSSFGDGSFGGNDSGSGNFGDGNFSGGDSGSSSFGDGSFGGSNSGSGSFGNSGFGGSDSGSGSFGNSGFGGSNSGSGNSGSSNFGNVDYGNGSSGSNGYSNNNSGGSNFGNSSSGNSNSGSNGYGNNNSGGSNFGNGNSGNSNSGSNGYGNNNSGGNSVGNGNAGNSNSRSGNSGSNNFRNGNSKGSNTGNRNNSSGNNNARGSNSKNKSSSTKSKRVKNNRHFWNIILADTSTFKMKNRKNLDSNLYAHIMGYNFKSIKTSNGIAVRPMIYGGYSIGNMEMPTNKKAHQTNLLFGGGVNLNKGNTNFQLSSTYNVLKSTGCNPQYNKTEIKSHMLCFSGRAKHTFKFKNGVWVSAEMKVSSSTIQTHSSDKTQLNAEHATANVITASPAVAVSYTDKSCSAEIKVTHHKTVGARIKTTILNQSLKIVDGNKNYTDFAVHFNAQIASSVNVSCGVTKSIGDKNGLQGEVLVSVQI